MGNFDIGPIRARLKEFFAKEGLNNSRFEKACGLYNGFVKDMDTAIKFESLAKIGAAYPKLNLGWLFSGVGEMMLGPAPASDATDVSLNLSAGHLIQNVFVTNFADMEAVMIEAIRKSRL